MKRLIEPKYIIPGFEDSMDKFENLMGEFDELVTKLKQENDLISEKE